MPGTVALLLVATLVLGCASGGGLARSGGEEPLLAPVPELEVHGLLLLMADQLLFEPLTVESALDGDAALREHLALTLGRVGDPRGVSYLNQLLADPEPSVRRAAAFALGEMAQPGGAGAEGTLARGDAESAARALLLTAAEPDREAAGLAVEALGKLGVSVTEVLQTLTAAQLPEAERWARLLPHLYRFDEPALVPVAEAALAEGGPLDPAGSPAGSVSSLAVTERDELRRGAAFALARDPRPEALPRLRRLLVDPDPRIRAWAARALGLVGEPGDLDLLRPLLSPGEESQVGEAPGPAVPPAESDAPVGPSAPAVPATAPAIQAIRAAALLAERHGAAATQRQPAVWASDLRSLLDDPRPHVRLEVLDRAAPWMAAGGDGSALTTAVAALAAGERPPVAEDRNRTADSPADHRVAGNDGGGVGTAPRAAGPSGEAGRESRAAGQATAGAGVPGAAMPATPQAAGVDPLAVAERAAALSALAEAFPERSTPLLPAALVHPEPQVRAAAAGAIGRLPGEVAANLLETLLDDPAPQVRTAAATALLDHLAPPPATDATGGAGTGGASAEAAPPAAGDGREGEAEATGAPDGESAPPTPAAALAARLLAGSDPGLHAATFAWLVDHPVLPYAEITAALQRSLLGSNVEAPLEGVRALAARATAEARERGGAVTVLEKLADPTARYRGAGERDWLVRRAAAAALEDLDRPAPRPGHPRGRRDPETYQQIFQRTRRAQRVEMVTSAGTLTVELDCPTAPRTCTSFLQLAGQGFFDGLTFHRVVPDFVVQGGDPRGDGIGGPGYTLRDEMTRLRYDRGVLGMALAGPHTGGSQFFLTLSPQPHLDGGYTAFGRVVGGDEVLDRITRGTEIQRVRLLD